MGDGALVDLMIWDGLRSTFDEEHMVQQAARVTRELGISREEQDEWALRSHERAANAQDEGFFAEEIVPVGEVAADEAIRRDTTLESLSSLPPVMDPEGTITAGNAPGVNDGASCMVVCSEEFAKRRGLEPLATSSRRDTSPTSSRGSRGRPRTRARRHSRRRASRSATWSGSR